MSFRVQDSSISLARSLRGPLGRLTRCDPDLARQVRRATSSIALNVAEGSGRAGKDRLHCFRVARGSALEVRAGLQLAVAWGHFDDELVARPYAFIDDILAMLTGLLR